MDYLNRINELFKKGYIDLRTKDLLEEYTSRLLDNGVPIIYNLRHLRKHLDIKKKEQEKYFGKERFMLYKEFYIPKKSGGFRKIEAPVLDLEDKQKWIKQNILDKLTVSENAKGFKKHTNIVGNALGHCNKKYVLNLDIQDFFPSISYSKVFRLFIYLGYNREVAHLLSKLCTNENNVLPQGASTSPIISNLVNIKLDKRLNCLAKAIGATYTRYADDITLSSNFDLLKYMTTIRKIIHEEGYKLNDNKTRLKREWQKQEVTGLIVNKKVAVNKNIRKELDNAIYFINKYGIENHMQHINCNKSRYKEHLLGLAYFIKMVDIELGNMYLKKLSNIKWCY